MFLRKTKIILSEKYRAVFFQNRLKNSGVTLLSNPYIVVFITQVRIKMFIYEGSVTSEIYLQSIRDNVFNALEDEPLGVSQEL